MVSLFATLCAAVLLAVLTVADSDKPDHPFYISSPNSKSVWHRKDHVFFEWRNPPNGEVALYLISAPTGPVAKDITVTKNAKSRFTGKTDGYCDPGDKHEPCARYNWIFDQDTPSGSYQALFDFNDGQSIYVSDAFSLVS
ncbi:uncharacterized protein UTRI_10125 [Ustilago trichophora]|uniref:Uncharacterized protein n=1 Tax=Ustilago trichophora TaxID=86804 RepID=A0A5C3DZK5_9BASI|nr:uncharacterized protein UTRI_10125 [Ustilago trichophora]